MVTPHQLVNGRSRQRRGSYQDSVERRAAMAVAMMRENGWSAKHTSSLLCVCPPYLSIARHLSDDDLQKLARGEIRLATLYRDYVRLQAERRAQRLAAEREAEVRAARQAELQAIHACLDQVCLTRFLDGAVTRYGGADVLEELDILFQRRGSNIVDLIISTMGADRVMHSLDGMATTGAMVAE
jgi:hypothetical protein